MNKSELIDAIAAGSGLTKTDSKKVASLVQETKTKNPDRTIKNNI